MIEGELLPHKRSDIGSMELIMMGHTTHEIAFRPCSKDSSILHFTKVSIMMINKDYRTDYVEGMACKYRNDFLLQLPKKQKKKGQKRFPVTLQ